EQPGAGGEDRDEEKRGHEEERRGDPVDDRAELVGNEIEEALGVIGQPVDEGLDPDAEGQLVAGEPVKHPTHRGRRPSREAWRRRRGRPKWTSRPPPKATRARGSA